MPFDSFETELLNDAWAHMKEESVSKRLLAFAQLKQTGLNNEGWFEWELYYRLLNVDRGWNKDKRGKGNRKKVLYGDGVDLQFSNGKFIEIRAITTEQSTMNWVLYGLADHPEAHTCLFLALYHDRIKKWLTNNKLSQDGLSCNGKYELLLKHVNDMWLVGMIKKVTQ